jgi:hypothetical protein
VVYLPRRKTLQEENRDEIVDEEVSIWRRGQTGVCYTDIQHGHDQDIIRLPAV